MSDSPDPPITILVVDDHILFQEAVCAGLALEKGFHVVGAAGDAEGAVAAAVRLRPNVVLLDVEIPGHGVGETLRQITTSAPQTRVIMVSMHDDPVLVHELINSGAHGYLLKEVRWAELVEAIRSVHRHDDRVVLSVSRGSMKVAPRQTQAPLSSREVEVLGLVATGLSNRQIGSRLGIAEDTVKRHLRSVFAKLDAQSRIDAVNKGLAAGHIGRSLQN